MEYLKNLNLKYLFNSHEFIAKRFDIKPILNKLPHTLC
jgi:hypothetical protein